MQAHPAYKHHVIPVINAQSPNMSVPFDRFHLSFLPSVADYGSVTTALVLDGRVFFVLNGDHHKQMHDCAVRGGLQACVDYFIEHIGEVNGMSEHLSVVGLRADPFELTQTALDVIGLVNLGALRGAVATATDAKVIGADQVGKHLIGQGGGDLAKQVACVHGLVSG